MSAYYTLPLPQRRGPLTLHADLFLPPSSTAADASSELYAIRQRQATSLNSNRKRPRINASEVRYDAPSDWTCHTMDSTLSYWGTTKPPLLVDSKDRLSEGLDTAAVADARLEGLDSGSQVDFRRHWSSSRDRQCETNSASDVGVLNGEGMNKSRTASISQRQQETWGQFVFGVVGGIAGKVWDICRHSTVRRFSAGHAVAQVNPSPRHAQAATRKSSWTAMLRLPGRYPSGEGFDSGARDNEEMRPAKRLNSGNGWVMVERNEAPSSRQCTAAFQDQNVIASSPLSPRVRLPRPATSRGSLVRRTRPSTARLMPHSSVASPTELARQESIGVARPFSACSTLPTTPSSAELQKLAAQRQRADRRQDVSIRKLNQQLIAMIKEGKAALAAKVEIQEDDEFGEVEMEDDEGYAEGIHEGESKAW